MPLRNVATTFTIEQQRLEINNLAGDVNNIANGTTTVGTATTASALAVGATGADLTLSGTLTVNGTQTILNTATLEVEDKNIIIAKGSTTDAAASGGGITLKGADDKTLLYDQTGDEWQFNKPLRVEGSQAYADSASSLETTVTKAAFRVKGATNSSDSLWMGVESTDANPYIQGSNGVGNNAKTLLLNPHGGRVGIGKTASAQRTLDIQTEDGENGFCLNSIGTPANYHFDIRDDNAVVLRVDSSGNVGINVDTPTRKLDVRANENSDVATFINSDLTNGYGINVKGGGTAANRYALRIANGADTECFKVKANGYAEFAGSNDLRITIGNTGTAGENSSNWIRASGADFMYNAASGNHIWEIGGTEAGRLTANGWEDSKGNLRSIPATWHNASTYTLVASDAGKFVSETYSGGNITVPASTFSTGDAITIMNHTGGTLTITQDTGVTMYNAADASTGNRQLAARGLATIFFREHNVVYISGAGLS